MLGPKLIFFNFIFFIIFSSNLNQVKAQSNCEIFLASDAKAWQALSNTEQNKLRKEQLFKPSPSGQIERRPITLTSGLPQDTLNGADPMDVKIDSADPSLIMPITYPNGVTKYRINFSGLWFIEADRPEVFFKGGVHKLKRSRGFYKDGTEMRGAYHFEAWPWDAVIYKNAEGELIALGGVMEQAEPGKLPSVSDHNRTRSRWWGKVFHVEIEKDVFEERIVWQAPIHDFNLAGHTGWKYHGYGGTLMTEFNPSTGFHEPIKNSRGNFSLLYERVTEEKNGMPWITTTFMREMHSSLKYTLGPEIPITNIISPATGLPFAALKRGGVNENHGYLREGDNGFKFLFRNKFNSFQFMKIGSGGDYVRRYGIYLDYCDINASMTCAYKNSVDESGELIDYADVLNLRKIYNATWVGRPELIYDPNGKLWLLFHYVPIDSIPSGGAVEGWPTQEHFTSYGRITAMFPVEMKHNNLGQPRLVADIDPKFSYMYE